MLNLNNRTAHIKRDILERLARYQIEGTLRDKVHNIPAEMAPKNSQPTSCCIYHDRAILRMRIMARLGFSVEDDTGEFRLADYVDAATEREKPTWPMLTVLDEACNACVRTRYLVTNACQSCLAQPCIMNCAKKAIEIKNGRSCIDESKCVNCGLCMQNCPYHAIIKIPVPCEEACPVGAISKNDKGKETINYDKCIFCGNCMRECPFGAMMDKSQLFDVIKHIMNGKNVVAMYAPAIAAQFRTKPGQLEGALKKAGFSRIYEVAKGADICAEKEAIEFEKRMEEGEKLMTTSCCSAYVRAVKVHVPDLLPCVSDTRSPMHYTAELAKTENPDCITVFIGPCLAKRREGFDDDFVDYVISVEELGALFAAKDIDVATEECAELDAPPTASARSFAASGGVANAVKLRLKNPDILRAGIIDGLDKDGMKKLAYYGKIQAGVLKPTAETPNLVEVMACQGGCIAGPCVVTNPKVAAVQLKKYVEAGVKPAQN